MRTNYEDEIFSILRSERVALSLLLGTLRFNDADSNENVKKTIGLTGKTTTLHVHHAFLYISLPVFARLRRENA